MFKQIILLLILFIGFYAKAQDVARFEDATKAYNKGEYEKAIEDYQKILENGQHSAALYYNLGNAYYKMNQIAPSIYYYEKALLLQPHDAEIQNNLRYAQNMTLDAIDEIPETGISKIKNNIVGLFSFDQWARLAVVFVILFVLCYIAFYYFRYSSRKRIAFVASIISLLFAIVSVIFAFFQKKGFDADQPAIVFSSEVAIRSEPNERSQEIFKLHEGAKVNVLESLNNFDKIRLSDGKTGWLPKESIKLVKDF
jgi:tetratricopeptide (TPR) repeat protein